MNRDEQFAKVDRILTRVLALIAVFVVTVLIANDPSLASLLVKVTWAMIRGAILPVVVVLFVLYLTRRWWR